LAVWEKRGSGHAFVLLGHRHLAEPREHASLLLPRIGECLESAGVEPGDLSGIIVGAGPGSFTGVRVGVATAKGMAGSLAIPLWAHSSLAAAAMEIPSVPEVELGGPGEVVSLQLQEASPLSTPRCVLFDARGDRVYAAAYQMSGAGLQVLLEPVATTVGEVARGLAPEGSVLIGDGAVRHQALLEASGFEVIPPPAGRPNGVGLLALHALDPVSAPLDDPGRWEPEYLRDSGAERMRKAYEGPGP
jgi:tRNA threonylcarbamoyladenosine biosynthesis protein TsaB